MVVLPLARTNYVILGKVNLNVWKLKMHKDQLCFCFFKHKIKNVSRYELCYFLFSMLSTIWSSFEFDSTDGQILEFLSYTHAYDIIISVIIQLTS